MQLLKTYTYNDAQDGEYFIRIMYLTLCIDVYMHDREFHVHDINISEPEKYVTSEWWTRIETS